MRARRGGDARATIVGATSGDTGSAAIEACRDRDAIDIFILYPHGRVSEVQRRQMTTVESAERARHRDRGHASTTARISSRRCSPMPGCARRTATCRRSTRSTGRGSRRRSSTTSPPPWRSAPRTRAVSFACRPAISANVYAGHVARRMGLPIDRLVIGTNRNDILARTLRRGEWRSPQSSRASARAWTSRCRAISSGCCSS